MNDVIFEPINTTVIVEPYEENPYKMQEETDNGIIFGVSSEYHKSNETGEMERNEDGILCAKVIAVGPSCRQVQVGDDVFTPVYIATPLPYKGCNYKALSETNIICIVRN